MKRIKSNFQYVAIVALLLAMFAGGLKHDVVFGELSGNAVGGNLVLNVEAATPVDVYIAGVRQGADWEYAIASANNEIIRRELDGAVEISSADGAMIVASLNQYRRVLTTGPYSGVTQFMALQMANISDTYIMPRYDYSTPDVLYDAVLLANVDTVSRDITVEIGGVVMDTYTLAPSENQYKTYPGVAGGPLVVSSDAGAKIVASLYELRREQAGGGWTGQSEMMGLSYANLSNHYLIPTYFGDPSHLGLDPQIFVSVP